VTFDAKALNYAAELARDRVLPPAPVISEILGAVQEYMEAPSFSKRLQDGITYVYEDIAYDVSKDWPVTDEDIRVTVRQAQSIYGLC
jgi:hypothetical protein